MIFNKKVNNLLTAAMLITGLSCTSGVFGKSQMHVNIDRAEATLSSIYKYYSSDCALLRENYPFDDKYSATYLDSQDNRPNPYAYLWPFSGSLTAVSALYEATEKGKYIKILENKVLPGLEMYYDTIRTPYAYSSYIKTAPKSDRFYDDNVWLGIDFCDLYAQTNNKAYLAKAEEIWKFIESGTDDLLGGGIYWCEQNRRSKHTCSNAPGSVYALKLYKATKDEKYLNQGKSLYEWNKKNLQDPTDFLYFDNMNLEGKIGRAKFAYNSGQMIQSAALLYQITKDARYLKDAQAIAESAGNYFFHDFTTPDGKTFRLINKGNIWFTAVMLRGFIELYHADGNRKWLNDFQNSLDWMWNNARDEKGLFTTDTTGEKDDSVKWVLTQGAMVEMYARLGTVK